MGGGLVIRIKTATLEPYRLTFRQSLYTAAGSISERAGVLLRLTDELGHEGVGDAAPLPGFSDESLDDVGRALSAQVASGAPLFVTPLGSAAAIKHFVDRLNLPPAAAHALDQALLDLLAKREAVSLGWLLADSVRETVPVHALVSDGEAAARAVRAGYTTLKAKVGSDFLDEDDDRLAAIRAGAGNEVQLRIDANGAWSDRTTALTALRRLSRYGVQSVEQPVPRQHIDLLAEVRAYSPVSVLADEAVRGAADLNRLIERHAADAVVIKPMLCGGLQVAFEMVQRAAAAGLPVSVTTSLESCVGRMGALQLASVVPGTLWSCGFGIPALVGDDLGDFPEAKDGLIVVPVEPGLGVCPR